MQNVVPAKCIDQFKAGKLLFALGNFDFVVSSEKFVMLFDVSVVLLMHICMLRAF